MEGVKVIVNLKDDTIAYAIDITPQAEHTEVHAADKICYEWNLKFI